MTTLFTTLVVLALAGPLADDPPATRDAFQADPSWKSLGKDIWFDPKAKKVVIRARVVLQDGILELFLCKKNSKEHESILSTEAPAQMIQAGLLLTGASPGHPVRFQPKFEPPTGSAIAIEVEWVQAGQTRKADAREWVKDLGTNKSMARDWVFAGSELFEDPRTKTMIFAADDGDLITVANFPASILDLPYRSSANDADRGYAADPKKVPPQGTPVIVYLSPRPSSAPKELPKTKPDPAR